MFVQTIFGRCLHHDAVHLAKLIVVGNIGTAAIAAQCVEHRTRRDTRTLALGSIHIYRYLREIHGIRGIRHSHFGTLVQRTQKLYHCLVERSHVTTRSVLQVQLQGVTHTIARNHTRLEAEYLCLLHTVELCIEAGHHSVGRVFAPLPLAPVLQTDDDGTVGSALTGHQSVSCHLGIVFYLGSVFQDVLQLVHHLRGFFQRASRRRADVHHDDTLVLLRHKPRLGGTHQVNQQYDGSRQ